MDLRKFIALIVALLVLSGCSAPPTLSPPREPQATPSPIPTRTAPPVQISISLSPFPLHGAPPFAANLSAFFYGDASLVRMCEQIQWRFGDGVEETQPCRISGEQPFVINATHTYAQPGTFHARAILVLANGQASESNTQTIVVAMPQPQSSIDTIVYWGAWGLTLGGLGIILVWSPRQLQRVKVFVYAIVALGLIAYVPPFSYLPNPFGFYALWSGNYAYDPRLPWSNRFVIAGDPTADLRPFLDGLIGQTGLDPLDPVQSLTHYEFMHVALGRYGIVRVTTRMTYADGSSRIFDIPLYQPENIFGFYQARWRYDGLGRLRTEQRELPGTPFADATSVVRLSVPRRLTFHPQTFNFDADNLANWGPVGFASQRLVWSPQQDAFLATRAPTFERNELWLVKLDGNPPIRLAQNVRNYAWSPDDRFIVFTDLLSPNRVQIISRDSMQSRGLTRDPTLSLPGIDREGVWYVFQNELWLAPYANGTPRRLAALPDLKSVNVDWIVEEIVVRPSPDGERVAYSCEGRLCLQDRDGSNWIRTQVYLREATWNLGGSHLAAVQWDYAGETLMLNLVRRDGTLEWRTSLAPSGTAAPPQWTPDGRRLFIQTFPFDGRRILTLNVANGEVLDLSQPRWDAWFALTPDGKATLLFNGRGSFWMSEIVRDE